MIAGAGYEGVELLADVPHLYPFALTGRDLEEVAESLRKHKIHPANINANTAVGYYARASDSDSDVNFSKRFWEPLFEPSLANPDSEARKWRVEYTKKCIDMAHLLSCPNVSITSGRMVPGVRPERSLELLRGSLDEVLSYAAGRGVRLGMEYEPGLLIERAGELEALIEAVGADHFGANLDLGHSHVLGEDPRKVINSLSSKIFHIHLEDIRAGKHYHLPPGEGDIDFRLLMSLLDDISYSGFVTVELYTYPDAPGQAAQKAFRYLKDLESTGFCQ